MAKSVLFIVNDFYPGGAQRQMYEIDLFCKRTCVPIEILSVHSLNRHSYFPDFFYSMHITLGTKICFLEQVRPQSRYSILFRIWQKLKSILNPDEVDSLLVFFDKYEKIIFMGEYVLGAFQDLLNNRRIPTVNVVIMSSRFQGEHYRDLNKKLNYNFISGFGLKKEIEFEFQGFDSFTHQTLPLSLDRPNDRLMNWRFKVERKKKIGIFTRLSKAKPLDPFFYTFHLLQKKDSDLELHIFGAGDPEEAGYDKYINHLALQNVFFRGHQIDIKKTLNVENLNLVWFQGYLNRPAGYAGFDTALTGTPQLFWDFFNGENPNLNDFNQIYPHFKDIEKLAEASLRVLNEKLFAEDLARRQFGDVIENRSLEKNLKNVLNFL